MPNATRRILAVEAVVLPGELEDIAGAREFLRDFFNRHGVEGQRDAAVSVLNELVTNAIVHGGRLVEIVVTLTADEVHISVEDTSSAPPVERNATSEDEQGRGLLVVERLSRAWGVEPTPRGKQVWARVLI